MNSSLSMQVGRPARTMSDRAMAVAACSIALGAIWIAVVLTGLFAKDFVSGTQQQHIHVAAFQNWFFGAAASGLVFVPVAARRRNGAGHVSSWYLLAGGSVAMWACVTLLSIFAPSQVTGSDPTRIPTAAILSPIVATVGTGFLALFVTLLNRAD